jgi:hypothetical protein
MKPQCASFTATIQDHGTTKLFGVNPPPGNWLNRLHKP